VATWAASGRGAVIVAGRSTRSLDVMRSTGPLSERAKSWLYTFLFWSGVACLCMGGALFGAAGTFGEYLVAAGVMTIAAAIWSLAHKLNPEDVELFFRYTSFDGKGTTEREREMHDI